MLNFFWTNSVCKSSLLLLILHGRVKNRVKTFICPIKYNFMCSEDYAS